MMMQSLIALGQWSLVRRQHIQGLLHAHGVDWRVSGENCVCGEAATLPLYCHHSMVFCQNDQVAHQLTPAAAFGAAGRDDFGLNNINIGIDMGSRIAIAGPNGAGKTTLMNLLSGEVSSSAAQALLFVHQAALHIGQQ